MNLPPPSGLDTSGFARLTGLCGLPILLHAPKRPARKDSPTMNRFLVMFLIASVSLSFGANVKQPTLTLQTSNTTQLLIAVSPVRSQVVWAAGTGGTYVVTTDGGNTWRAGVVPGTDQLQFRSVYGVSDKIAYLMSIGNDADQFRIYKTTAARLGTCNSRTRPPADSTIASPSGPRIMASRTAIPITSSFPTCAPPTV